MTHLEPPRFEHLNNLLIAGLSERYSGDAIAGIPAQWRRFVPYIGRIPEQAGSATYGVCRVDGEGMEYICGVEVSGFTDIPPALTRVRIPEKRYAVFTHRGHISQSRDTWQAILKQWLPASGYLAANTPEFERYSEEFDARTGVGLEIWIPLRD